MSWVGQSNSFAPITVAALIWLAGVAFGDYTILPPVRVDGDATKMATKSYKYCWNCDAGGQWYEER